MYADQNYRHHRDHTIITITSDFSHYLPFMHIGTITKYIYVPWPLLPEHITERPGVMSLVLVSVYIRTMCVNCVI